MRQVEDKLENFHRIVMHEAAQKREQILKEVHEYKKKILEQKEIEFLENAYRTIQKEIRKIQKEKNETVSRAIVEGKKLLFKKREEIVEELFVDLLGQIQAFKKTPQYVQFLVHNIMEGCKRVGEGQIEVYLDASDINMAETIQKEIEHTRGISIVISADDGEMIGGCKIMNKTKNIIADYSLRIKIQQQKEQFLKTSGLVIE